MSYETGRGNIDDSRILDDQILAVWGGIAEVSTSTVDMR